MKLSLRALPKRETYELKESGERLPVDGYWYKHHEVVNDRRKTVPETVVKNAMLMQNMYNQNLAAITKDQAKLSLQEEQLANQLKAEFMRPKAVVFDAQGNFHRTRVDEQSFL